MLLWGETLGSHCLKKTLPGRNNIVLSKTIKNIPGVFVSNSLNNALSLTKKEDNVHVIGGEILYKEAINSAKCDKIFVTEVDGEYECDTFFPHIPKNYKLIDQKLNNNLIFKIYKNMLNIDSEEKQYLECMNDILLNGYEQKDRTGTGTISVFDKNMSFSINKINNCYQFPLLTTKKVYLKGIINELLWFLSGNTNAKWLQERNTHIWDGHSSKEYLESVGLNYPEGEIGPGYGHQWIHFGAHYPLAKEDQGINQIQYIINELGNNPNSRRAVLSAWNPVDLNKMALPPCHVMYIFNIINNKLNCKLIMRSNDMFLGCPFNIASASILTIILSKILKVGTGKIAINIANAHIYSNHTDQVKLQLERIPYQFPNLKINKKLDNYEDVLSLTYEDFELNDYYCHPAIKAKIAI